MYFLRRLRPLEVVGERVRSLRVSLNAPVLTAADLPAGPARGLVVVHQDARGRMDATVGARCAASGEIAYWSFDGDLLSNVDVSVAADAALTFAESLGFLFDEDSLAGAAAEKAFRAWSEGEPDGAVSPPRRSGPDAHAPRKAEPAVLELEDLVIDEQPEPAPEAASAEPAPAPAPPEKPPEKPARRASQALSKFRARATQEAPAEAPRKAPLRQPLARVQLVKRRSPEEERKLALRRLITSF